MFYNGAGKPHGDLEKMLSELNKRFMTLESKIDSFDSKMDNLSRKFELADNHIIQGLESRLDIVERMLFSLDAVIGGIPKLPNEDINAIYAYLCKIINVEDIMVGNIFRVGADPLKCIIIAKFAFTPYKIKFIEAFRLQLKSKRITLDDIGLVGNSFITEAESLTTKNRKIFNTAIKCKRQYSDTVLRVFFTRNGKVLIKFKGTNELVHIHNESHLLTKFPLDVLGNANSKPKFKRQQPARSSKQQ